MSCCTESYNLAVVAILNMMRLREKSYIATQQEDKRKAIAVMIKDIEFAMLGKE